jgi:hypothetical protein
MEAHAEPEEFDFTYLLPTDAYHPRRRHITLPPSVANTPEDLARRDNAAVASPVLACSGKATLPSSSSAPEPPGDGLPRVAWDPAMAPELALESRAQAGSMMRQSQGAIRLLRRIQVARNRIEADTVAAEPVARTKHSAAGLMTQALPGTPPVVEVNLPPSPPASTPAQEAEPKFDPIAATDEYAKCPRPAGASSQPIVGTRVNEQIRQHRYLVRRVYNHHGT